MKKVPLKDYQLLLDDSAFRVILGDQVQWQTYSIGGSIWLCAEFHEHIWTDKISKLHNYCFLRPLRAQVCRHPTKPDYLLLMVQKECSGRLTQKKLTPEIPIFDTTTTNSIPQASEPANAFPSCIANTNAQPPTASIENKVPSNRNSIATKTTTP